MKRKLVFSFAILLISCCQAFPQNDELPNPLENDNQFPPEEIPETTSKTNLAEDNETLVSEVSEDISTTTSEELTTVSESITTEQPFATAEPTTNFEISTTDLETTVDESKATVQETAAPVERIETTFEETETTVEETETTGAVTETTVAETETTVAETETTVEETETTVAETGTTVEETETTIEETVTNEEPLTTIMEHDVPTTTEHITAESNAESIIATESNNKSCPEKCYCKEGDEKNLVVDCVGNGLEDFPKPLDPETTSLLLQNNKIPEIPKDVSELKKLKELNLDNNLVANIASGSLSELPELVNLKLKNNKLEEFPNELMNSFGFSKLEELDLGGNKIKTAITPELLSNFKSLNLLVLPNSTPELVESMCTTFKDSLKDVCNGSCEMEVHKCSETLQLVQKAIKDAEQATSPKTTENGSETTSKSEISAPEDDLFSSVLSSVINQDVASRNLKPADELGSNADVQETMTEPPKSAIAQLNAEVPKEANPQIEGEVKVGATTANKEGGIDKSVIGLVVAGMILVVAVVTIQKNWGSIKKRFSASPRAANATANGHTTIPEEVPLQDKNNPV